MSGRHLAFPFRIAQNGRPNAVVELEEHVKHELVQLLLTNAGERPFLPGFGGSLRRLVFENNSEVAAGIAKASIADALSRWLGHRIELLALEVENDGNTLGIDLQYRVLANGEQKALRFEHQT